MAEQILEMLKVALICGLLGSSTYALVAFRGFLQGKLTAQEYEMANEFIKSCVVAAEYLYKNQAKSGDLKYQYVVNAVKEKGLNISNEELEAMVNDAIVNSVLENENLVGKRDKLKG